MTHKRLIHEKKSIQFCNDRFVGGLSLYPEIWICTQSSLSCLYLENFFCIKIDNSIYITLLSKVKLPILVKGDPKTPFSIATTPRCRGERYSFPVLLHFTLDAYLIMLSVNQGGIKYHFWVFGMTRPGIEPRSPGSLANTLLIIPIAQLINIIK